MKNPVGNLVRRCLATITDDGSAVQRASVKVHGNDASDDVERWQQYGVSGHPAGEVQGLVITANGTRFLVAADDAANRPSGLVAGEVKIWSSFGQSIHLKADGSIQYTATRHEFVGDIGIVGKVVSTGNIETPQDVIAGPIALKHHEHDGVQPGGGITGEPV